MMRLAHIAPPWIPVPPADYGGTELVVDLLVRGLRQRRVEVLVFCSGDSGVAPPRSGPYPRSFWPPDKFSENLHLSYAWEVLRRHPAAIVHSHLENAAGFWQATGGGPPLVITLHTPVTDSKQDYLLQFPQVHLVAASDFQRRRLAGHPRLQVIPHGIEVEAYTLSPEKDDYLLFLGRIYPEKGLHTAIAAAQATERRLVCAGPVFPPDQAYFESHIAPHLDNRRIFYVGPADFARKVELLGRAQALVAPLDVDEAFGLVLLEAMACGTPVIAYDRGAVPEVVAHGVTGFVARSFDELLAGIKAAADLDPMACRGHVARNYSWDGMVESYLTLYKTLV